MGVPQFELADHISGVHGDETDTDEDNQRPAFLSVSALCHPSIVISHGANPRLATAAGKDKTPNEMVSATITVLMSFVSYINS